MSVGLSDIFGSNILDESRFKPWWEKIREYAMRGLMVTSFLAISEELTAKPTQCTPRYPTPNYTMSTTQSQVANSVCYHQQDITLRFAGIIAVSASAILYFCFSLWYLFPRVITRLSTVKRTDDVAMGSSVTSKEIEDTITMPFIYDDIKGKEIKQGFEDVVRNMKEPCRRIAKEIEDAIELAKRPDTIERKRMLQCLFIQNFSSLQNTDDLSIPIIYMIRNISSSVVASILIFVNAYLYLGHCHASNTFYCSLTSSDVTAIGTRAMICAAELPQKMCPYTIVYLIFTIVLLIIGVLSIILTRKFISCCYVKDKSKENDFIRNFSGHSRCLYESTIRLLELSSSDKILNKMKENIKTALIFGDATFADIYIFLCNDGIKTVENSLEELIVEPTKWFKNHTDLTPAAKLNVRQPGDQNINNRDPGSQRRFNRNMAEIGEMVCIPTSINDPQRDQQELNRPTILDPQQHLGPMFIQHNDDQHPEEPIPHGNDSNIPVQRNQNAEFAQNILSTLEKNVRSHDSKLMTIINKVELTKKKNPMIGEADIRRSHNPLTNTGIRIRNSNSPQSTENPERVPLLKGVSDTARD